MANRNTSNNCNNPARSRVVRRRVQRSSALVACGALLGGAGGYGVHVPGMAQVRAEAQSTREQVVALTTLINTMKETVGEIKTQAKETAAGVNAANVQLAQLAAALRPGRMRNTP